MRSHEDIEFEVEHLDEGTAQGSGADGAADEEANMDIDIIPSRATDARTSRKVSFTEVTQGRSPKLNTQARGGSAEDTPEDLASLQSHSLIAPQRKMTYAPAPFCSDAAEDLAREMARAATMTRCA